MAVNEKLQYGDIVIEGNGESTMGSSKRHMSQTEFSPALDGEITPPNQLRYDGYHSTVTGEGAF